MVFDAADLEGESAFWAQLLDGTVERQDDWHAVSAPDLRVDVQLAPDHQPPQWPDGLGQQVHLDLFVEDIQSAHGEALACGARLLREVDEERFRVYADPAGHPFCLCWD